MTAFSHARLAVRSYAQGFTEWVYVDRDASIKDIMQDGFFNDAADVVKGGDAIMATARDGGALLWVKPGLTATVETLPLGMASLA